MKFRAKISEITTMRQFSSEFGKWNQVSNCTHIRENLYPKHYKLQISSIRFPNYQKLAFFVFAKINCISLFPKTIICSKGYQFGVLSAVMNSFALTLWKEKQTLTRYCWNSHQVSLLIHFLTIINALTNNGV